MLFDLQTSTTLIHLFNRHLPLVHPGFVRTDMTQPKSVVVVGDMPTHHEGLTKQFGEGAVQFGNWVPTSDIVDCFLLPLQDNRINGSGMNAYAAVDGTC